MRSRAGLLNSDSRVAHSMFYDVPEQGSGHVLRPGRLCQGETRETGNRGGGAYCAMLKYSWSDMWSGYFFRTPCLNSLMANLQAASSGVSQYSPQTSLSVSSA